MLRSKRTRQAGVVTLDLPGMGACPLYGGRLDRGPEIDPNGGRLDLGPRIDPNGNQLDLGPYIDPLGGPRS